MTVTNPSGPEESRRHRAAMWLGHHASTINLAAYSGLALSVTLTNTVATDSPANWLITGPALAGMTTGFAATICDHTVHRRNLCLRDVNRPPLLNPQHEVDRHAGTLRAMHSGRVLAVMTAALLLLIAGAPISAWAKNHGISWHNLIFIAAFLPSSAVSMWNVWAAAVHHRLQPWCPQCRWGRDDGGDDGDDGPDDPTDPSVEQDRRHKQVIR